mgnify:FL=1
MMVSTADGLEPINSRNMHQVLTAGAIIKYARVMIPSCAVSDHWISLPITLNNVIIQRAPPAGFTDEIAFNMAELRQALTVGGGKSESDEETETENPLPEPTPDELDNIQDNTQIADI